MARKEPGLLVQQYGALPWQPGEREPLILLVTTRGTGRWILPKGWAEPALSGPELAAKEAFEEAGIVGEPGSMPLGSYRYWKTIAKHQRVRCLVDVFPLRVQSLLPKWPEARQRRREWLPLSQAAKRISEAELRRLLRDLASRTDWHAEIA